MPTVCVIFSGGRRTNMQHLVRSIEFLSLAGGLSKKRTVRARIWLRVEGPPTNTAEAAYLLTTSLALGQRPDAYLDALLEREESGAWPQPRPHFRLLVTQEPSSRLGGKRRPLNGCGL